MFPTTIIDKSIAHRAWKIALSKSFKQNSNCPNWFETNLFNVSKLVENKLHEAFNEGQKHQIKKGT